MAGKVFFSVTMSLDGFMAPDAVSVEDVFSPEGQNDPRVQRWMRKWYVARVRTHAEREPWERPGGTTFHFVNDGIKSALNQARDAAGDRDVRVAGGAETIQEYLDGGLVDEFSITLAPVLFGTGIRLFDRVDPDRIVLDQAHADASSRVTHLTYTVGKR